MKLGEVCEFKYGDGLREDQRRGGSVPVFGSNGLIGWHDSAITKGQTIIIGRKGSLGEIHFSKRPCWPIDTTYYIDEFRKPAEISWFYYLLQGLELTKLNKAAAVPGLNRNDAYEIEIPFPPLPEQKHIAAILSKADRLRRIRRYARKLSDAILQSVFLEMFGDPVSNPMGWNISQLVDITTKFSDGPFGSNLKTEHYKETGVRVIRLQNIGIGEFIDDDKVFISEDHFTALSKHKCIPGDLIVGTLGDPNLRAFIMPNSLPVALNKADCVQVRLSDQDAIQEYICWLINHPRTLILAKKMLHGQTRTRISMGQLKRLEVPVPPMEIQWRFKDIVRKYGRIRTQVIESARQKENLFQSLLNQAFSTPS